MNNVEEFFPVDDIDPRQSAHLAAIAVSDAIDKQEKVNEVSAEEMTALIAAARVLGGWASAD